MATNVGGGVIVAFTGHRPNKLGAYYIHMPAARWVVWCMEDALDHLQPERIISGMAQGVDTWAALIAINRGIPLTAAIPCEGQEKLWPKYAQTLYRRILRKADEVVYPCPGPYSIFRMALRNQYMVNRLEKPEDTLVAVWDGSPGGTGNCVRYAQQKGKCIYRIIP